MEEPFRDSVKSVLINTHLKDTLPDIDLPRQYNSAFDKHLPMSQNRNMGINTEVWKLCFKKFIKIFICCLVGSSPAQPTAQVTLRGVQQYSP